MSHLLDAAFLDIPTIIQVHLQSVMYSTLQVIIYFIVSMACGGLAWQNCVGK
jgi:hypothetical protein